MRPFNTYRITAYLKVTIDIEARDDDEAIESAEAAQLADWQQGDINIRDVENLGAVQNDND